jgi:hypothetical protein
MPVAANKLTAATAKVVFNFIMILPLDPLKLFTAMTGQP